MRIPYFGLLALGSAQNQENCIIELEQELNQNTKSCPGNNLRPVILDDIYQHAEKLEDFDSLFLPTTDSYLSRHLTREMWNEYKDQSCKYGVSFKTCIRSGIMNQDSSIGVYAGSHQSYKKFSNLFDKVIQEYHDHEPGNFHVSDLSAARLAQDEFTPDEADMIISTRIRVARNLVGYPLGPGVDREQRLEIMEKVRHACEQFPPELAGTFHMLENLTPKESEKLIKDHFLMKEGDRFLDAAHLTADWPSGRGIFYNDAKTFLIWVNEEDQLRIISMQPGADVLTVFQRLSTALSTISDYFAFAYDNHLGYISSCPSNLGTALRASVHVHLPKLAKYPSVLNAIADKYHVQIRGVDGEHSQSDDFIYDVSNKRRLGQSEVQLVQDMIRGVQALIKVECVL